MHALSRLRNGASLAEPRSRGSLRPQAPHSPCVASVAACSSSTAWKFTLAEFVGGIVLIALMWLGIRLFVTRRLEEAARAHAVAAQTGHQHVSAESGPKLFSLQAWSDVAHNFRGDWEML